MPNFERLFGHNRVMVILRGCPPDEATELANRAWQAGVKLVEVPLGTETQLAALKEVTEIGEAINIAVGAGTVITPQLAKTAAEANARYTVAPGLDPDVLSASLSLGLPHLPGVATPTEVQAAQRAGCRWVKVFPAATLGPQWVKAMRGPFPDIQQVVTGGISVEEAKDYFDAGARIVAFGADAARKPDLLAQVVQIAHQDR